jgi:hypothetical protein
VEASADPVKKQDGLALRLLPLHSMLAYTLVSTLHSLYCNHTCTFLCSCLVL